MKTKTLFVASLTIVLTGISIYTHIIAYRLRVLDRVIEKKKPEEVFTGTGLKNFIASYSCLSDEANEYLNADVNPNSDSGCIHNLKVIIREFPVHLLGTRESDGVIELDALFNTPNRIVITFVLKKEGEKYKLADIKNLCNIWLKINDWCKNVNCKANAERKN